MNILYVEDELLDAELVQRYMKTTSHHLVISHTLEEARDALQEAPDLILVDLVLHKAKLGYGFAQELRDQGYTQPIVAVTGLALAPDIERCYQVGFTDVLTKPYAIKQLAAIVGKYTE